MQDNTKTLLELELKAHRTRKLEKSLRGVFLAVLGISLLILLCTFNKPKPLTQKGIAGATIHTYSKRVK